MCSLFRRSSASAVLLALGVTGSAVVPTIFAAPSLAQTTQPSTPSPTAPSDQGTPSTPSPATPPTSAASFSDVAQDYWASPFIQALAAKNVIAGFPDGTFKPDQPVTRAEFAAMIAKAFNPNPVRQLSAGGFSDVPSNYWAAGAIQKAYETGFMSGYPGNVFRPNQQIPKVE